MPETEAHKELKKQAETFLKKMGCDEIYVERKPPLKYKLGNLRPDLVGIKIGETIAVECGTLDGGRKQALLEVYNKVYHFPYIGPHQTFYRRKKKQVVVDVDLCRVVEHICVDKEITFREALDEAFRKWVSDQDEC